MLTWRGRANSDRGLVEGVVNIFAGLVGTVVEGWDDAAAVAVLVVVVGFVSAVEAGVVADIVTVEGELSVG